MAALAPVPKTKRVSLQLRLSLFEIDVIEQLAERMGGANKRDVVEEALRCYLRAVDKTGRFVQRSRLKHEERRKLSQRPARRYEVDAAIMDDLKRVSTLHHFPKMELVRQAILTFGEQAKISPPS